MEVELDKGVSVVCMNPGLHFFSAAEMKLTHQAGVDVYGHRGPSFGGSGGLTLIHRHGR
jgi:hypothetical protein